MRYVIVGGGVAGVTAAKEIRKLDPDGLVDLFSNEPYPYYYRPRLWEFVAGRISAEETYYRPASWYAEQGIQLHLQSAVVGVDVEKGVLKLNSEKSVAFDRLVIASGARSFVPSVDGADQEGVFALRSLDDAKLIASYADRVESAVLIGGGLLGLETAKALSDRGLQVSVVEFMPRLLPRQLDEEGAEVLQAYLEQQGLDIYLNAKTEKITAGSDGMVVQLADGRHLKSGMVVFSTGIRSNIEPWQSCGLKTGRGVQVNDHLMTSVEGIYAAGDAAEFNGTVYGIIPAAIEQGKIAGTNSVNPGSKKYSGTVPSTRLKIAGMAFNAYGESTLEGEDVSILREVDRDGGRYERFAVRDGRIVGAIVLGNNKRALGIKKLIESGSDVSGFLDQLLNDEIDLKTLVTT